MFYLDETWFNGYRSPSKTWQDSNERGSLKLSERKSGRVTFLSCWVVRNWLS
jgi:hypothetical protein